MVRLENQHNCQILAQNASETIEWTTGPDGGGYHIPILYRAVTVPLIPFPVQFGSVFQQKPRFRFGSVFSYLLTIFGHLKS